MSHSQGPMQAHKHWALTDEECSRVAIWKDGHPTIVEDEEGNRSFASYVSFTKDGRLIGTQAKSRHAMNTSNT